ncbi:DUF2357 domain-containing protein [Paenibacillus gallinarum]|uniref:DUF2357 domain-containing protein n=1 Tax=Paenibacillus gallinarum TaxID=2762232 RepID=A0ABR8T3T4_9BACL|nr:DUF2357 domain-containing protein [Paenibacillus gallinarum]MBD7970428.1 DUF2357 domain-containing protein [Paenibacillus gallinarum]
MRLLLRDSSGYSNELIVKSQTISIDSFFNYLELIVNEETLSEVKINNILFSCKRSEDGSYIIPCYMSRDNHTVIEMIIDNKPIRIVIKFSDELFIGEKTIDSFADFHRNVKDWLGDQKKTIESLLDAIKGGNIHLLQIINPLTGLDDQTLLEEIYKVMPFALDICTKPRQHLLIEEEILDVELVKRVTPSSLQHLASHSEHWRSRTITGLIPSRLRAEVYEDDINIYENIFFKMVIEAILNYVVRKHEEVKLAISQKDTLHDWEFYATEINDYKKLEMLHSLLPEYNSESEEGIRRQFKELEKLILTIEKQLSSVVSTPFFQSINASKRLELPIQPTNIINMDNRYNELFKIWNKLLVISTKTQQDLTGSSILDIDEYYQVYIQILSIYSLHLLGYQFSDDSYLELITESKFNFHIQFSNEYCVIEANNQKKGKNDITFRMEESLSYAIKVPNSFPVSFKDYEEEMTFKEIWSDNEQILLFRKKPNETLEKQLSQVIKKYVDEQQNLTTNQKIYLKNLDRDWRKHLTEEISRIPENRTFTLNLHTLFNLMGDSENNLQKYTTSILDSVPSSYSNVTDIFILPINLADFSKVENSDLLQRLINFGEAYTENDAKKYGDYQVGILPISQTDLRSIQRLSKLFNLFIYRQLIRWSTVFKECPACGSANITKTDEHTWQCRSSDCHLVWGVTRCSHGCNEFYEWMKPSLKPRLTKFPNPNLEGFHLEKILQNEMLFDRMVITAFDFQIGDNNEFIYNPRCPKCGKSKLH